MSELKFLNNLRGKLIIEGISRGGEDKEAILGGKQFIESLSLYCWGGSTQDVESEEEEAVLVMESLQPHPNLKKLCIKNYR